jgi:hypothetical protein
MQLFGSNSKRNADRVVIAEDGSLLHPCRLPASHKGIPLLAMFLCSDCTRSLVEATWQRPARPYPPETPQRSDTNPLGATAASPKPQRAHRFCHRHLLRQSSFTAPIEPKPDQRSGRPRLAH